MPRENKHYSFLLPGKFVVLRGSEEISTNVGSCIAVVLHDSKLKITGVAHYVVSKPKENQQGGARYGIQAIPQLIKTMEEAGSQLESLHAQVFGGANVFRGLTITKDIGEQNISVAFETLSSLGIPIVEQNVGGVQARKLTVKNSPFDVKCDHYKEENSSDIDISGYGGFSAPREVSVAIVDDNEDIRDLFKKIFTQNGLKVVGTAGDAHEARELIVATKPMVVTLDIEMPKMSGVDFLKKLMEHFPIPVVMVSQLEAYGRESVKALEYGAVEFVQKPSQYDPKSLRDMAESLVEKVRAAAFKSVSTRKSQKVGEEVASSSDHSLIVVGGNIGSPNHLRNFLEKLPKKSPPVVVADSTIGYFLGNFVKSLKKVNAVIPSDEEILQEDTVYFIPKPFHGVIRKAGVGLVLDLKKDEALAKMAPSLNILFGSAARSVGNKLAAVLLSSFGNDGIQGLENVASSGGSIYVQSPEETDFSHTLLQAIEQGLFYQIGTVDEIAGSLTKGSQQKAA